MIQPVNALTPRAGFRGSHEIKSRQSGGLNDSQAVVAKAVSLSAIAGGLTTIVARSYTNSFAHAGVLGTFGAFLTMFFMTPHLIDKIGLNNAAKKIQSTPTIKQETSKAIIAKRDIVAPVKRFIQFKAEKA